MIGADNPGDNAGGCTLLFGNFRQNHADDFGRNKQYGAPNLSWFFGQNTGGPRVNPCIPETD